MALACSAGQVCAVLTLHHMGIRVVRDSLSAIIDALYEVTYPNCFLIPLLRKAFNLPPRVLV